MKVKIFEKILLQEREISSLESEINKFIKNKEVISITQSQTPYVRQGITNAVFIVMTVLYKEA